MAGTPTPRFTSEDLFRKHGQPQARDIQQDALGDCFFVASLGAIADQQPSRIKDMIQYDPKTETFSVTLHKDEGGKIKPVKLEITQAEIEDNLKRQGGSTVDNRKTGDTPIWPAVIETAFAKLNDSDPKVEGLKEGYNVIAAGGKARNAMLTLTGSKGEDISNATAQSIGVDKTLERIDKALMDGRPVTLSTDPEKAGAAQDGLVDNHVYTVERMYKNQAGDVMVDLRNPWTNNSNVGEGKDNPSPIMTVKFNDILKDQGFEYFNIGPEVKTPTKTLGEKAGAQIDALLGSLGDPGSFKEALKGLAGSPDGQAFHAEGKQQAQDQQSRQAAQQPDTVEVAEKAQAGRRM